MMRKIHMIAGVLMSVGLMTSVLAQDSFDGELRAARGLVEKKSYGEALKIYDAINGELRKDPGLIIEWARVYTYADDHVRAIKLFEEVQSAYPARADEILRELADQYLWGGHFSEAIRTYDALLKRSPDNKEVMIAKADALALHDKLEEAYALYQKVLDQDAGNLTAINAQAKILVWQGYIRRGIARYEQVLRQFPKNPDAIEGLAFAWHWWGDDVEAVKRLEELLAFEPDRKEAAQLYAKIKGTAKLFIKTYGHYTSDSTPQTVFTSGLRGGTHINATTSVDGIYEHQTLRKKGAVHPSIAADREGAGISKSFGSDYALNAFVYQTHFNKVGFEPVTANTWFTYKPDDLWRFDAAYERETFEDNDALLNKIITNSASLSADFKPNRFWLFGSKFKRSYYSDDNVQSQVFSKIEYRLWQKPFVKLFYNDYYSAWGEPELSHGYFNPRTLRSDVLGLYTGVDLTKKLFVEATVAGGYEFQNKSDVLHKKSNHPLAYGWMSMNYRATDSWLITASGDYFTTWPDHGQRSYQKRGAYLSFTFNFGASHLGLPSAGRPYRTTDNP